MKRFPLICTMAVLALAACQGKNTNDGAGNVADVNVADINAGADAAMNNASADAKIDTAFVTDAIEGDNGEVVIGKLAADRASSQSAKDYGKMLSTDHGAHKAKLAALAATAGVPVPDKPSDEGQKNIDKLSNLSGAEFDKAFKAAMIEDHNKDIAKYEKQASSGDPQTAALARETLPTLRKHLATAKAL